MTQCDMGWQPIETLPDSIDGCFLVGGWLYEGGIDHEWSWMESVVWMEPDGLYENVGCGGEDCFDLMPLHLDLVVSWRPFLGPPPWALMPVGEPMQAESA